jgi:hypothetical protein
LKRTRCDPRRPFDLQVVRYLYLFRMVVGVRPINHRPLAGTRQ